MTRHSIDDYGHTTETVPAMITDEWAAQHLPLTQVALAAAVPIIEAEVRERIEADLLRWGMYWRDDCGSSEEVVRKIVRGEFTGYARGQS